MRLQLPKHWDEDKEAKALRAAGFPKDWEDIEGVLQYWELPYVPEIIRSKLISCHHDDPLTGHFGIDKTKELVDRKYYWPSLRKDIETILEDMTFVWLQKPSATSFMETYSLC